MNIILREKEVRQKIMQTINESELPAFMVRTILKDYYEQLESIEQQQYQEALAEEQKKEDKKNKGKEAIK